MWIWFHCKLSDKRTVLRVCTALCPRAYLLCIICLGIQRVKQLWRCREFRPERCQASKIVWIPLAGRWTGLRTAAYRERWTRWFDSKSRVAARCRGLSGDPTKSSPYHGSDLQMHTGTNDDNTQKQRWPGFALLTVITQYVQMKDRILNITISDTPVHKNCSAAFWTLQISLNPQEVVQYQM